VPSSDLLETSVDQVVRNSDEPEIETVWIAKRAKYATDFGRVKKAASPSQKSIGERRVQEHAGLATMVKPRLIGRVKHLRGNEKLRHASLQDFRTTTKRREPRTGPLFFRCRRQRRELSNDQGTDCAELGK
jgi:hypothetical protein